MFDDFKDMIVTVFQVSILIITGVIILFAAILLGGISYEQLSYKLSQDSYCTAYVNNKQVYTGLCHFLSVHSIGENGNTKELTIYRDRSKWHPIKRYVNNEIKVEAIDK